MKSQCFACPACCYCLLPLFATEAGSVGLLAGEKGVLDVVVRSSRYIQTLDGQDVIELLTKLGMV